MKYLDRGGLVLLLGIVALVVYVESRGGFRAFLAERGPERTAEISVPQNADGMSAPRPSAHGQWPSDGTALFANPIAAAEGAEGTIIAPMSATSGGAVKIAPSELADPAFASRVFRDPDKGLLFVSLPDGLTKPSPPQHRDDGAQLSAKTGNVDVMHYFRSYFGPKAQPRAFPVSM